MVPFCCVRAHLNLHFCSWNTFSDENTESHVFGISFFILLFPKTLQLNGIAVLLYEESWGSNPLFHSDNRIFYFFILYFSIKIYQK